MGGKTGKALQFAPIVKLSTEGQARKGESMKTRRRQIEKDVKRCGGVIQDKFWDLYCGQEHASENEERRKLDRLLRDAERGKFDAVIVTHPDRWSRDNRKSKEGLQILRENGIQFFVGTQEYDVHDPTGQFMLSMTVEIGEYQAGLQAKKSIENRIERAKKGIWSFSQPPFGRRIGEDGRLKIIPEGKAMVPKWAGEYLPGSSYEVIGRKYGQDKSKIHRILTEKSGSVLKTHLSSARANIHEEFDFEVPPLLDAQTIKAIKVRGSADRTYDIRRQVNRQYLLNGVIFCADCNYAMTGQLHLEELEMGGHMCNHRPVLGLFWSSSYLGNTGWESSFTSSIVSSIRVNYSLFAFVIEFQ